MPCSPGCSTNFSSHIHRAPVGERLPAQYFDVRWTVRSQQIAKDLATLMPAGARVDKFTAVHANRIM